MQWYVVRNLDWNEEVKRAKTMIGSIKEITDPSPTKTVVDMSPLTSPRTSGPGPAPGPGVGGGFAGAGAPRSAAKRPASLPQHSDSGVGVVEKQGGGHDEVRVRASCEQTHGQT